MNWPAKPLVVWLRPGRDERALTPQVELENLCFWQKFKNTEDLQEFITRLDRTKYVGWEFHIGEWGDPENHDDWRKLE